MSKHYVTSESVTEGHPDKVCDQISDGILDAVLAQDPRAHVAIETMASKNTLMIAGELTTSAQVDVTAIARKILLDIGYTSEASGIDGNNCLIFTNINVQSADIALGVNKSADGTEEIGGGDQGIMYGYATNETKNYMPYTIDAAHSLVKRLAQVRKEGIVPWLYPDGKAQVTVGYDNVSRENLLTSVVLSAQHYPSISYDYLKSTLMDEVIAPVLGDRLNPNTKILINPTGRFIIGGPLGDTGLTGRKIMVDTYGGIGKHGGGAFSGKDPTKVDRTAAYMARYVAKNIVAANLADRCEVSIAYAIGQIQPEAVNIETFGTEHIDSEIIRQAVEQTFDFTVAGMIKKLELRRPQFLRSAAYGHFGREDQDFGWEKLDMVETLRQKAIAGQYANLINR